MEFQADDVILTDIRNEGTDQVNFNMYIESDSEGTTILNQMALQQAVQVRKD